jgi:soluble lytic murein transglycosylase-like protein
MAILLAAISLAPAHSSPYQFSYDLVGTNGHVYPIPNGYIRSELFETTPIKSKHLDLYDDQDAERLENEKKVLLSFANRSNTDKSTFQSLSYDNRIAIAAPKHQFTEDIFIVSQEYNIDPLLLHAIAEVESDFNAKAVSRAGAQGLMQVMPETARRFGMQNPKQELFNPISNLRISSNYIRSLHKLFGNNIPLILAAYNAGEHAVIKYGYKIPPYRETENYVDKVMKRYLELKDKSYQL